MSLTVPVLARLRVLGLTFAPSSSPSLLSSRTSSARCPLAPGLVGPVDVESNSSSPLSSSSYTVRFTLSRRIAAGGVDRPRTLRSSPKGRRRTGRTRPNARAAKRRRAVRETLRVHESQLDAPFLFSRARVQRGRAVTPTATDQHRQLLAQPAILTVPCLARLGARARCGAALFVMCSYPEACVRLVRIRVVEFYSG